MATYEIQWGSVQRPTHRNTSWDWARFETCAQKWVDLSENDYGVSLLNESKYGHDIHENVIRISLLRASTFPDANADLGEHTFTYSLLPHAGCCGSETIRQAYLLNIPTVSHTPQSVSVQSKPQEAQALVSIDCENIVIETVKQAEDRNGLIVRLYEYQRQRGTFTLRTSFELAGVWRTNLLEKDKAILHMEGKTVSIPFKPYQIMTLQLIPR
jgi:alpha-mannosidase